MPSLSGKKWADFRTGDLATTIIGPKATVLAGDPKPRPKRRTSDNCLSFEDYPTFRPNKTPFEVLEAGAFGGGYFRPIYSDVVKENLRNQHEEFDFLMSLPKYKVTKKDYDASYNKYKVKCGGSLQMWQSKGWISPIDPYGWFQWYCRFYAGRRCTDDERQVKRWERCTGKKGRWKNTLLNKILKKSNATEDSFDDYSVSPVIRQTLLHWGYEVTKKDLTDKLKEFK